MAASLFNKGNIASAMLPDFFEYEPSLLLKHPAQIRLEGNEGRHFPRYK